MTPPASYHLAEATRHLLLALHWDRYFSDADRTVRRHATEAGRSAFFGGCSPDRWAVTHPEAMGIARIRDAMVAGWQAAATLLADEPELALNQAVEPTCPRPGCSSRLVAADGYCLICTLLTATTAPPDDRHAADVAAPLSDGYATRIGRISTAIRERAAAAMATLRVRP